MSDPYRLERFIEAQRTIFDTVLAELKAGSKQSHWIWFIFPQLAGLGRSPTARYFAIASIGEAQAYLAHPVLGSRLRECLMTLLTWAHRRNAEEIFGPIDALKLQSSLTLFEQVEPSGLFFLALAAFFEGRLDESTLALLNSRA